jgi:hypothetical protein
MFGASGSVPDRGREHAEDIAEKKKVAEVDARLKTSPKNGWFALHSKGAHLHYRTNCKKTAEFTSL